MNYETNDITQDKGLYIWGSEVWERHNPMYYVISQLQQINQLPG